MTGVGRPVACADRISADNLICEVGSRQSGGARSRTVSRDALIAQGAPALADILMRACLDYPELAAELVLPQTPKRMARSANGPEVATGTGHVGEFFMIGDCTAMQAVFQAIRRFATTSAPILITGESGTGKELAAQAIHERSRYSKGPFIPVNCGGLPPSLIATELFGHERGAFTGAVSRRIGRFEEANGGTLFLDEIGDLPLDLQSHLLRFLQNQTIERVGNNQALRIDTRIIAATNVDLERAVSEGRFRQDLFFRLDVLRIHMPPLRNRENDIGLLAKYFLTEAAHEFNVENDVKISDDCMSALRNYAWPGNVRELISKIRRAVVMAGDRALSIDDFDLSGPRTGQQAAHEGKQLQPTDRNAMVAPEFDSVEVENGSGLASARAKAEESAVREAIKRSNFNVSRAAKELGVSRVTMYKLMDRYGIQR